MGTTTITEVVPADATPDPMAPPTTSYLARTTSYTEVLAGYVAVLSRCNARRDLALAASARR
jgi:hypothetical protein